MAHTAGDDGHNRPGSSVARHPALRHPATSVPARLTRHPQALSPPEVVISSLPAVVLPLFAKTAPSARHF